MDKLLFIVHATVGAATSRPQRNGTARLVEWYHVRHSTNSPKLIRDCGFVPRGRLRASPTVLSWCCGNSPNPVHHSWLVLRGRLVAAPTVAWMSFVTAKLQFTPFPGKADLLFNHYTHSPSINKEANRFLCNYLKKHFAFDKKNGIVILSKKRKGGSPNGI